MSDLKNVKVGDVVLVVSTRRGVEPRKTLVHKKGVKWVHVLRDLANPDGPTEAFLIADGSHQHLYNGGDCWLATPTAYAERRENVALRQQLSMLGIEITMRAPLLSNEALRALIRTIEDHLPVIERKETAGAARERA
ncbi:beta barrel domain-containing protein [Streptomyces albidoflavus]|uniref:beta barrel domain-containing protein n=1 Tax=Streptomyces albidoflavus TaxID=1886 RepID=UPI0033F6523B